MKLRFRNTDAIVEDLPAALSWSLPITGNLGSLSAFVPRSSPAYAAAYIRPQGLSDVTALDSGAGPWTGIITATEYTADGVNITAQPPWVILSSRRVRVGETYTNVLPGFIAYQALLDALPGVRGLSVTATTFDGSGGPLVTSYALNGQSALQVLTDMMDASDQELHVDAVTGLVGWGGMFAYASAYQPLLVAGASLLDMKYSVNPLVRLSEVTLTSGASSYTTRSGDAARDGWPAQTAASASSLGALVMDANTLLDGAAQPAITVTGSVGPAHFDIRERMFVTVLAQAEFTTKRLACRVLGRALPADGKRMTLTLQVIPEALAQRFAPATRSTRADVRGRGTLAGELRFMRRNLVIVER